MAEKKAAKKATSKKAVSKKTAAKRPPAKKAAAKKPASKRPTAKKAVAGTPAGAASARIDKAFAELRDWRGERLAELRKLIHEVDPGVVEDWKWMGTPVWSHEGMYVLANPHKDKVKITFHHGAQLNDPQKLFNNGLDGNKWRAIDLYEKDRIDQAALKALLREAIAYNEKHAVPKSKGSRIR